MIRLTKAPKLIYSNRDVSDLRVKLEESKDKRIKMVVTDGVFSMDGTIAPLREICDLADEFGAVVLIDECHATGFMGTTGRGTEQFLEMGNRVQIINSTLGKALGGAAGGYTCGPKVLIDLLRQKSRPYLFSNTLPPAVVAAGSKALDLIETSPKIIEQLQKNTLLFREGMKTKGFSIMGDCHPICPVFIGDAKVATEMADALLARDIYVIGFSYPVVEKGKARIRVQISGAHTPDQINFAIDVFSQVGKQFGVIN